MALISIKDGSGVKMMVAHRGATNEAPENTIASFKKAWELGADAIEGDFRLTKDGFIVCIHDENTLRVSGKNLKVDKSTLEELRSVNIGKYYSNGVTNEKIATIDEVFEIIPKGKKILIEVKCGVEIIPELMWEIYESGLNLNQIGIISFNKDIIKECKEIEPKIIMLWLKTHNETDNVESIINTLKEIGGDGILSDSPELGILGERIKREGFIYHNMATNNII
jgi:glycerophosphoryl diester phosphodiesterase